MAFKIDLTKAHPWPATLGRPLDKDGAFRFAALLAAMRVIAPMMQGDGFARHFKDATYPPDFAAADKHSLDAYRAMAALFAWDGGYSTVLDRTEEGTLFSPVTPGTHVFVDVLPRSAEWPSSNPYEVEMGAVRNEVNSCLASAFPYRYWWQAFNRAMYNLMRAWPSGYFTLDVYRHDTEEEDVETATLTRYPYVLSEAPDGASSKTIDELLTEWMPHADASTYRPVMLNEPWLMTAEDIDFAGVFHNPKGDTRAHALRILWNMNARNVGFYNYADTSTGCEPDRWSYKDGLDNYWAGKTKVRYAKEPDKRLAQLTADWDGSVGPWRDEFPYHGFAAMQAYLNYFEQKNLGFVIASDGYSVSDPDNIDDSHTAYDRPFKVSHCETRNVRTFDAGDILTGLTLTNQSVTMDVTGMISETEPEQYIEYYDAIPEARIRLAAPGFLAPGGSLEGTADDIHMGEGAWEPAFQKWTFSVNTDDDFFAQYLDSETALDFADYTKAKLEELLAQNTTEYNETPSRVVARSEASVAVPNVGGGDTGGIRLAPNMNNLDEDKTPYHYGANLDDNLVYFLKTTSSSRIARSSRHDLFDHLRAEAGVPATEQLQPLGIGDGKITATFRLVKHEIFNIREIAGSTMIIYDNRTGREVEVPLIEIYFNQNPKRSFPFEVEDPGQWQSTDVSFGGSYAIGDIVGDVSDESSYDTQNAHSRLEILRQMQFVRYPERVVYP